ncbi:MAG TPA: tRNA (adenosine(37)-N6)-dimethylallyltransferase MiaA [Candidatus Saccharimonadales bacterium]|nr:tRNA (adenosine(37)-N6)-dimethylallyltransferase MiaA [Candidatus Saccharimonadales bacterium]
MATSKPKPKLLVIVGPTASGKSDLAFKVAKEFNGEIIAADSRTIYKDLDVGTAKPTMKERAAVAHWGLDLVEPGGSFTVADFKKYAQAKIQEIQTRGRLPILVGGTGLYIDSVLFDFDFRSKGSKEQRDDLEKLGIDQLHDIINKNNYPWPENLQNKRHLIRIIETAGALSTKAAIRPDALVIGLLPSDKALQSRIDKRADKIFSNGVMKEYKSLVRKWPGVPAQNVGIVYKLCSQILAGGLTEEEAKQKFKKLDWQYARRQRTWFRRNDHIHWFENGLAAKTFLKNRLNT